MRASWWAAALLLLGCGGPSVMPVAPRPVDGGVTPDGATPAAPSVVPTFMVPDGATDAGGGPQVDDQSCAQDTQKARLSPVDLLLLLDASGSMAELAGTRSRWALARDGLARFLGDDRSAGLGVGLQLFPLHTQTCDDDGTCFLPAPGGCQIFSACVAPGAPLASGRACGSDDDPPCQAPSTCVPMGRCSTSGADCLQMGMACPSGGTCGPRPRQCRFGPSARGSCNVADYQKPLVEIADLPGSSAPLVAAIDGRLPIGGTPLGPAVQGALAHLKMRAGRRAVLVIVTDGVPEGCSELGAILTNIGAAAATVSTYVVGVFADGDPPAGRTTVQQLATAGKTTPVVIGANQDLSEQLLGALNQIRGAAVPCDLAIPRPASGQLDFGKVNVEVGGAGGPADLVYVADQSRCAAAPNGWYYDVDPKVSTPARVHLCAAVCDRVKADPQGSVALRFGCKSRTID